MAREKSVAVAQVRIEQKHAEEQVMAQSALIGERLVAKTRATMFLLIGVSTVLVAQVTGNPSPPSALRTSIVGLYFVFCAVTVVMSHRTQKASARRAMWLPFGFIFLASESTWLKGGGKFNGERVGEEHVKGRDAGVIVYSVRELAS